MTQSEPKRIGDAMNWRGRPLPEKWEDWDFLDLANDDQETWKSAPMVKWNCPDCGKTDSINAVLHAVTPHGLCDECVDRRQGIERKSIRIIEKEDQVKELIPPIYLETDPDRLPYPQRQEVMDWKIPADKRDTKGVWIVGDTRTGKTRMLCLLLRRLIREGKSVKTFFHGSFGDELLEVIRSERSFRAWKRKITGADILAIDDLFSFKMTERVEASIFEILDERIAWHRPTFVTTQLTKTDAKERFASLKRWEAFFARIREYFHVVTTTKPIQGDLKV